MTWWRLINKLNLTPWPSSFEVKLIESNFCNQMIVLGFLFQSESRQVGTVEIRSQFIQPVTLYFLLELCQHTHTHPNMLSVYLQWQRPQSCNCVRYKVGGALVSIPSALQTDSCSFWPFELLHRFFLVFLFCSLYIGLTWIAPRPCVQHVAWVLCGY